MVLKTVRELPDDCSIDEIADRIEFLAALQKGLDQLDRGEGIPHDEIKKLCAAQEELRSLQPDPVGKRHAAGRGRHAPVETSS